MNTIPTTFDEHQITRTIIGGKPNGNPDVLNISVILLNNSGSHFKINVYKNLLECKFESIISIEHDPNNSTIDDISKKMPEIKFIIPQEETTNGELINLAMAEIKSDYVLVLKDSLALSTLRLNSNAFQRLVERKQYCYVPRIFVDKNQVLPINMIPHVQKGMLKIESVSNMLDNTPTLYPYDFLGLYNRQKFIQLGGFDYTIESPYWQNLDLALRAWLWGENIRITTTFGLSYLENAPVEDATSNLSQFRFYLKNLAPQFKLDHGEIPVSTLFRMIPRSACGLVETINQFKDARRWVEMNQYRFKTDTSNLILNWGSEK